MITAIILATVILTLVLSIWLRSSKGQIGEKQVARILGRLPKDRYLVINNMLLRTASGGTTQIDHVVISEYGIFVIETKYYKGWIYGGENGEYWTQNIYGHKYTLRNPIQQNMGHIRALKYHLKDFDGIPFISIVAFSRSANLRVDAASYVVYWNRILPVIRHFHIKLISYDQVLKIHEKLLSRNRSSKEIRKEHIRNVRSNEQKRNEFVTSVLTNKSGMMPSPPANAPVVAATLSSATGHTAPSTAAPTTLDAATSSNNRRCFLHLLSLQKDNKWRNIPK